MLLYFAAGLLPDPDGHFTPIVPNFHTWIAAISFEVAVLLISGLRPRFSDSNYLAIMEAVRFSSGILKACILLVMCAVFVRCERRIHSSSKDRDYERLLTNGHVTGPNYDSVNEPSLHKPSIKADAQTTGWLDYLYGFRALFPYIWYVQDKCAES